jgi:hypothetical protein
VGNQALVAQIQQLQAQQQANHQAMQAQLNAMQDQQQANLQATQAQLNAMQAQLNQLAPVPAQLAQMGVDIDRLIWYTEVARARVRLSFALSRRTRLK